MTREEAIFYIKELQKTYASMDKKVSEAVDMAIEALQDDWIPVSERLPEVGDTYIVSGRMKYDFEKEYTYFTDCAEYLPSNTGGTNWETWTDWYEGQQEYEILAWKPLPVPYNGDMKGAE